MRTVSVIIPARNRADILPLTLATLARQSFPAAQLEVVVVNDGSTDGTAACVRATRYPFRLVYVGLEPRPGLCIARPRNHGLYAATGEIALFLDADLLAFPDLVAGHVAAHAAARGPQAVIGYTYAYPIQPAERSFAAMNPPPPERLLELLPELVARDGARWRDGREPIYAATDDLARHPHPWQMFWGHNVSVPRRLALEIGGFDEGFVGWGAEDLEFAYRLWRGSVSFRVARNACGAHYPHPIADLEQRWAELQRNRRRFIGKHPGPQLELRLWNAQEYAAAWQRIAPLLEQPPDPPARRSPAPFLEWLRAELFPPGPLLLCGLGGAAGVDHEWPPPAGRVPGRCEPFGPARDGSLPLLGVFTPWEDGAFAGAVVGDYWRCLPPAVVAGLVREMLRVAGGVALLCTEATGGGSDVPLPSPGETIAAPGALPDGYRWEILRRAGTTALLAREPAGTAGLAPVSGPVPSGTFRLGG